MPWAAIIPAVAGLAGSVIGGKMSADASAANAESNYIHQMEFARRGIQYKVADAKEAGIHPLFALGAQTHAFTPTTVGTPDYSAAFGKAGQDIGRAVASGLTSEKRDNLITQQSVLQTENMSLQNDLLRSQIARLNSQVAPSVSFAPQSGGLAGQNPGNIVGAGQGIGPFEYKPSEVQTAAPGAPNQGSGPGMPVINWGRNATGVQAFPPKGLGVEDEFMAPLMTDWYVRNRLLPNLGGSTPPSTALLEATFPGATGWHWSHRNQQWEPTWGRTGPRYIGASVSSRRSGIRDGLRMMEFNNYQYGR